MTSLRTCLALLFLFSSHNLFSQGVVYLVLGSDTAIWESMDVNRYSCTYQISLYTDPARNATRVMDPLFRQSLLDSYGTPVKLTWWMMAGNIFRHATNTNVPHPNTMTMYLMKKYHGSSIQTWGDELTLHYHTFVWTDYDGDGKYYWNQARSFNESSDDFDSPPAADGRRWTIPGRSDSTSCCRTRFTMTGRRNTRISQNHSTTRTTGRALHRHLSRSVRLPPTTRSRGTDRAGTCDRDTCRRPTRHSWTRSSPRQPRGKTRWSCSGPICPKRISSTMCERSTHPRTKRRSGILE